MPLSQWFAVALGGALGAVLRQYVALLSARMGLLPFVGTLTVNVIGCFAIGWLLTWAERTGALGSGPRNFWVVGTLGAFTTYSTFAAESLELLRVGRPWLAALNVLLHLVLGAAAIVVGRAAAA